MHPDGIPLFRPLAAALVIGIIVTVAFLFITSDSPVYFTEIYFESHQSLPEKVRLDRAYPFAFTIHSLENETKDYGFTATAELFNMYDVTEGTYQCLGQYRDKVDLEWEFGRLMDYNAGLAIAKVLDDSGNDPELQDVRTNTTAGFSIEAIGWPSYTVDFAYSSFDGLGRLGLVFMDGEESRHALVLSEEKNRVLFATFSKNSASIVSKGFNFTPEKSYKVRIDVKPGNVSVSIDGRHILSAKVASLTGVRLGFEAVNTYAFVTRAQVAKEGYSYKDSSTIKSYEFDDSLLRKERERLIDERFDYIFQRLEATDKPGIFDWLSNATGYSTGEGSDFETITTGNSLSEGINWTDYNVQFGFSFVQGRGKLALVFEGNGSSLKYGFLVAEDGNAFFARPGNGSIELVRKRISLSNEGLHTIRVDANQTRITAYLDGQGVFNVTGIRDYTNGKIRLETEDSAARIENLQVQDNSVNASDRTLHVKYIKKYRILYTNDVLIAIEASLKQEFSNPAEIVEQAASSDLLSDSLLKYLDPTDHAVTENVQRIAESFNPGITSKKIVFDGISARISGWDDYTFSYRYSALDGTRQVVNSFQDYEGNDLYSFFISEKTNQSVFIEHKTGRRQLGSIPLREGAWQNVRLHANGSAALYYINGQLALNVSGTDFSTGQFMLGTESANAQFSDIYAISGNGQKKIYEVNQDPCQLQKVGEVLIGQGRATIEPGEQATVNQTLYIRQLFDFAKVSVNANKDEIHFWVRSI